MTPDVLTIAWKELREVLRMGGNRRGALWRLVFSIGILGVIWPWQVGAAFVTSRLVIALAAFTAAMHVAGLVPDSFAGERERHTLETLLATRLPDRAILLGKIAAMITYGLGTAVVMLTFGWATVNIVHHDRGLQFFSTSSLFGSLIFSILAAGLFGAVGILISLRSPTVKQAQQVLSTAVMILLFVPAIALPTIPPSWHVAIADFISTYGLTTLTVLFALFLLCVQLILYAIALARFKRNKLIVEQ